MEKGQKLIVLGWVLLLMPWTLFAVPAVASLAAGTYIIATAQDDDDDGGEVAPHPAVHPAGAAA